VFEVLDPGLLTTIQADARWESTALGVPLGGPCDVRSMAIANLLLDNEPTAAALEMTIVGPTLAVSERVVVGVAGADLGGRIRETGVRLLPGRTQVVEPGSTLEFAGTANPRTGARAYLAVAGGVDVPVVLGSRSTCLAGGFGGLGGRRLAVGDRLRPLRPLRPASRIDDLVERIWPAADDDAMDPGRRPFRVLPGPAVSLDRTSLDKVAEQIVGVAWGVAADSDRTGLRLTGPVRSDAVDGERAAILSHGVVTGSIQLPPDGLPIVLLVDHQTTGGYPVPLVVIAGDHDRLGQLRPGAEIGFEWTSPGAAVEVLRGRQAEMAAARAAFREGRRWDDLWHSIGG
jgi:biotin-dependent carboxylase-like uncharacterized protein